MSINKTPIYIYADTLVSDEKEILEELLQTDIPDKTKVVVYYLDGDDVLCFTVDIPHVSKNLSYKHVDSLDKFIEKVLENKMNYLVGIYAK